ncbi:MAG: flippase-like domain-containing protein [Proteobacteria bacterium]|nr:flippase-like domain-containing protein [Pseudomonadota bacterium]MBU1648591.1 flippase-like domain-containing protein [Pseudomonadota bacterium]MBU1985863.1 flippase-like domain-containing protein [Pseudomonadota bacterium]
MQQWDKQQISKKHTWRFRAWFAGILLLSGLIISVAHVGEIEQFVQLASKAHSAWLIAALLLQIATYFCVARIWQMALGQGGMYSSMLSLAPLGVAKLFSDQAMPSGGMTGTVFFFAALKRRGVPPDLCMGMMLVSLISYYAAYLIVAMASIVLLWFYHAINPWIISIYFCFCLVAVIIPVGTLMVKHLTKREIPKWIKRVPGALNLLQPFAEAPLDLLRNPMLIITTILLQGAIFILDSITLWVMLLAIGQHVSFFVAFPSFVLASIVTTIGPIPLGIGTFEAACVTMLRLLGIQLEPALTATILLRGFTLWLPMLPGLWLTRRELR